MSIYIPAYPKGSLNKNFKSGGALKPGGGGVGPLQHNPAQGVYRVQSSIMIFNTPKRTLYSLKGKKGLTKSANPL